MNAVGIILGSEAQEFVRKCRNIQNELHQEDPDKYPRDARTAYVIHPDDLIAVHKEAETQQQQIKAFLPFTPEPRSILLRKRQSRCDGMGRTCLSGYHISGYLSLRH